MKHFLRAVLMIGVPVALFGGDSSPGKIDPAFAALHKEALEELREVGRPTDDTHTALNEAVDALVSGLEGADRIEVFQGLPREIWNGSEFAPGKKPEACREIAGQWFYPKPQAVEARDLPALKRMLKSGLMERWGGMKLCGGFHADYALAITKGRSVFYLPTCLGCHEARLIRETGPAGGNPATADFRVTVDVSDAGYSPWAKWLEAYRREQPAVASKPPVVPAGK